MLYPIFFLITYLYPSFWIIRNIVTEKERGIRETLKTMVASPLFHYGLGPEGPGAGVLVAGHLLRGILDHFCGLYADAEASVRVLQSLPLLPVLRLFLLRDDDALLSNHLLLLEGQNRGSVGRVDHLYHLRSLHSV